MVSYISGGRFQSAFMATLAQDLALVTGHALGGARFATAADIRASDHAAGDGAYSTVEASAELE